MFTGIIEGLGQITNIESKGSNVDFTIKSSISSGLKVDQSVAHNGVCMTVVKLQPEQHVVTAVNESLLKTTMGSWAVGQKINLERCVQAQGRFDGHFVQGHVDKTVRCSGIVEEDGSWYFTFDYHLEDAPLLVAQGSICINGVSLTIARLTDQTFTVAIIPYTYEHTMFNQLKIGELINIEFDVIGKYVQRNLSFHLK